MKTTTYTCVELAESQLFNITGGLSKTYCDDEPIPVGPPKDPVYITMAIGEGGGSLPDLSS